MALATTLRFEDATVEKILGPGGLVSQMHPGYEHRPTQIALAKVFERAIREGRHAVTEAGTGSGKSYAYTYPGVMAALQPGGPVVIIAVPDKNLQNQLVFKDLPSVAAAFHEMGKEVKFVHMFGRKNFACHYKINELKQLLEMSGPEILFRDHKAPPQLEEVLEWAENDEDGILDDAPFDEIHWDLKSRITVDADGCLYRKCPFFADCRVERRKEKARHADVIVVNHSLLLRDLQLRFSTSGLASVIPIESDADGLIDAVLVIDEAHELEDQATEAFATEVTLGRYKYLLERIESFTVHHKGSKPDDDNPLALNLPKANERRATEWSDQAQRIYDVAKDYFISWEVRLKQLKKAMNPTIVINDETKAAELLMELVERLAIDMASHELSPSYLSVAEEAAWGRLANSTMKLFFDLRRVVTPERVGQRNWVRFADKDNRVVLHAKPIKVGPILRQRLWDVFPTVLATSATLAIRGDFKVWKERCGAPDSLEIAVESPFDYQRHARIYLPANAKALDPSKYYDGGSDQYFELLANEIYGLVDASDGGAFVLFTSRRVLDGVFNLLEPRMSGRWPLFYHSVGANRGQMVRDIKAINNGVLFGLKSFWKGVDVPGDACVPPGTLVRTSRGYKPIEDVVVGDKVWSHTGRYNNVTATMVRDYEGELVKITPRGSMEQFFTPEHPLLVSLYGKADSKRVALRWVPAGELTQDHRLALPVGDDRVGRKPPGFAFTSGHRRNGNVVPCVWEDSPAFWELVGLWTAEGSISKSYVKLGERSGRARVHYQVQFSFGSHEEHTLAQRTCDLIHDVLGNRRPTPRVYGSDCHVGIKNDAFAGWLEKNIGRGANNKRIPVRLLRSYSQENQAAFLVGYLAGDGCVDRRDNTWSATSASKQLILGVRDMAAALGHPVGVYTRQGSGFGRDDATYWNARISHISSDKTMASVLTRSRPSKHKVEAKYVVAKPRTIERVPYSGKVYNLSVARDESYTLVGVCAHNCRLVIIDKLPYPPPGDPVWDARRDAITAETGDQWAWFNRLSIPYATVELKQGAGRLIRKGGDDTEHDYGVIALLDGRLSFKGYGKQILASLPPAPQINKIAQVREFFAQKGVVRVP